MTWIFTTVLNWFTGGGWKALAEIYAKGKDSAVESERIQADVAKAKLDAMIAAQAQATEVRLQTSGFWEMRVLTFLIAGCFVLHLVLVTADTCFQLGLKVPAFPPPFDEWEGQVLLSFFALQAGLKGIDAIAGAIGRRRGA
ncbi:hypothetical protein G3545_14010 [Starkeya sp. ORNL1]|uniref:hypothetical protein n=1 Tax=Starkeya sp. ORNL1 TaxID=2709380 RepID=UPI0014644E55|nr:hypothetical protein [Starkeya sp. ORNL1]QJP14658.1 hypothetical protein G3545_14010 [Starkeya sp. ORNL1]